MRSFHCDCGQRVFFDSTVCLHCGLDLSFDPDRRIMVTMAPGSGRRYCRNRLDFQVCNWLAWDAADFCQACSLNEVIPNLDVPGNLVLWGRLEAAKRRLLYTLMGLNLAIRRNASGPGLRFRFLEDQRRNPGVLEDFVATGHTAGTITINLAEADPAARAAAREEMLERYRTLLGHFRHESAHYYFSQLLSDPAARDEFRSLFGDETADYAAALNRYYASPPVDWSDRYVSAYATAHPHEDWAETFAHYLHIVDALETAADAGLSERATNGQPGWILRWMRLSVTLNELNRSLGLDDPYPFVLTEPVIRKLRFIDRLVARPAAS